MRVCVLWVSVATSFGDKRAGRTLEWHGVGRQHFSDRKTEAQVGRKEGRQTSRRLRIWSCSYDRKAGKCSRALHFQRAYCSSRESHAEGSQAYFHTTTTMWELFAACNSKTIIPNTLMSRKISIYLRFSVATRTCCDGHTIYRYYSPNSPTGNITIPPLNSSEEKQFAARQK